MKKVLLSALLLLSTSFMFGLTWDYVEDTETLYIAGNENMPEYASIEETPWKEYKRKVKVITIAEGIETVGSNAFTSFYSLKKVNLPRGVKRIGERAFAHCEKLEEIELPQSLVEINKRAFESCYNLKSLTIPSKVLNIDDSICQDFL